MRVLGSLPPPWIPYQLLYENNKECVCVGSLPPPRIPYQFPYENNKECVCVWAPFLLLGFLTISV